MILTVYLLVGLVLLLIVSAHSACNDQACRLWTWSHVIEPIALPVSRRRWLPIQNFNVSTSSTRTSRIIQTISTDSSFAIEDLVPTQQNSHGSFPTSHELRPLTPGATVSPASLMESIVTSIEPTRGVYKSSSSVVVSTCATPLSPRQTAAQSAINIIHATKATSIAAHDMSSLPIIPSTRTRAGNSTWTGLSTKLAPLHSTTSVPAHETPSTSILSTGWPPASFNTTNLSRASPTTILRLPPVSQYLQNWSRSRPTKSNTVSSSNAAKSSMVSNHTRAHSVFQSWNGTTSSIGTAIIPKIILSTVSPTREMVISATDTSSHAGLPTASLLHLSKSVIPNLRSTIPAAIDVSSQGNNPSAATSFSPTQDLGRVATTCTTTLTTIHAVTGSETGSTLPPPPLTTSQTAGVAIAGTTGLLFAVVTVLYIARRQRSRSSRRSSTGVYPKIAYLYDPPPDDESKMVSFESTMISGGIFTRSPGSSRTTHASSFNRERDHIGAFGDRSRDVAITARLPLALPRSRPSIHHEWEHIPAHSTNTSSNTISGHKSVSWGSPTQHTGWHPLSPQPGGTITRSTSAAECSILSDITSVACSTREDPNSVMHPRMSTLRGSCSFRSTTRVAEAI
ncbi:hypothetical protein DE146DRAFT_54849 [Phaeosphaeria sp. MPI-PUGE-AT-0046c]|nr:hypothetical protein DE146DRAFT_54849 [Phaeosphaeria sp. MPI-PUGE-AT-0046c]